MFNIFVVGSNFQQHKELIFTDVFVVGSNFQQHKELIFTDV